MICTPDSGGVEAGDDFAAAIAYASEPNNLRVFVSVNVTDHLPRTLSNFT